MKKIIISIVILVLVIVGAVYMNKNDKKASVKEDASSLTNTNESVASTTKTTINISSTTKTFTLDEVKKHNKDGDCWTTISGKVYDLTTWPENHPGGDKAILRLCGIDGTNAYNKAHGGQEKPEMVLGGFYIGDLAKN